MGVVRCPEIRDYFSKNYLFYSKIINKNITYIKFTFINTNFSFIKMKNNEIKSRDINNDMKKNFGYLNEAFIKIYSLAEKLCIYEGIVKYHGKFNLKFICHKNRISLV
ncbi:hypothetical protein DMUE_3367 [Dictyocoela muelleri]|nr:hypothetical protein DMUE_3367 [Dictyocoela muelleri]